MVSDKFTLDSVKGHRIYLSLKSVAYVADLKNSEHYLALFSFVLKNITLVKNMTRDEPEIA